MKKLVSLVLILMLVFTAVSAFAEEPFNLGLANINEKATFGKLVKMGFENACEARGWTLTYMDNNSDGATAVNNATLLVNEEVDFIVDLNVDQSVAGVITDIVGEAGIPMLAVDIAMGDTPFFGIDSNEMGLLSGAYGAKYIQENISHEIPGHPIPEEELLYHRTEIAVGKMRRYAPATALPKEHVCPFVSSNSVFVRWDGDVVPCMQLLHNTYTYLYEQKRKITRFAYGNVAEQSLLDCWNRQDYREFRHRVNTFYFPFCTCCWGCEDREENLHDCFLGEAPTCGGCLWSTGQVFCP